MEDVELAFEDFLEMAREILSVSPTGYIVRGRVTRNGVFVPDDAESIAAELAELAETDE